jgi:hypothetical protein
MQKPGLIMLVGIAMPTSALPRFVLVLRPVITYLHEVVARTTNVAQPRSVNITSVMVTQQIVARLKIVPTQPWALSTSPRTSIQMHAQPKSVIMHQLDFICRKRMAAALLAARMLKSASITQATAAHRILARPRLAGMLCLEHIMFLGIETKMPAPRRNANLQTLDSTYLHMEPALHRSVPLLNLGSTTALTAGRQTTASQSNAPTQLLGPSTRHTTEIRTSVQ